ncbi:ankyrin repeat domain-containing protein [Acidiphilium iwatense]|uniref:Ankyrin repeat domain-containing protein n=1 Tax=Acidiphilium iwatense TaxID=768198 RepID=A0ABS9DYQ5_9PROT|nr:ankyrin repeat domain-containing protein [Acidiphilium iwatense]MCF3946930.1 ankyrin repeat domain-containing protein [Acidiphilium iwatense]
MTVSKPALAAAVALLSAFALTGTAAAQMPTPGAPMAGPAIHPQPREEQVPPPALPGAANSGDVSAGPIATAGEDPTKLLFSAINHGNYTEARAAVSRGANLDARNALGETPIEMSVELNRNDITFMLLSVRQEEGPGSGGNAAPLPVAVRPSARTPVFQAARSRPRPAHSQPVRAPASPDQPGVPNPAAGFLGFGGHS